MSIFTLSKTWQVLGPFPIGTREQDFGADPLENYGNTLELNIFIIMGPFFYMFHHYNRKFIVFKEFF